MSKHNRALPALEVANSDLAVGTTEVANASPVPLLVNRKQARRLLGNIHGSTLWRWEKLGIIQPIRVNPNSRSAAVFYRMADILRIVGGQS